MRFLVLALALSACSPSWAPEEIAQALIWPPPPPLVGPRPPVQMRRCDDKEFPLPGWPYAPPPLNFVVFLDDSLEWCVYYGPATLNYHNPGNIASGRWFGDWDGPWHVGLIIYHMTRGGTLFADPGPGYNGYTQDIPAAPDEIAFISTRGSWLSAVWLNRPGY